jgi:hypothetical protein
MHTYTPPSFSLIHFHTCMRIEKQKTTQNHESHVHNGQMVHMHTSYFGSIPHGFHLYLCMHLHGKHNKTKKNKQRIATHARTHAGLCTAVIRFECNPQVIFEFPSQNRAKIIKKHAKTSLISWLWDISQAEKQNTRLRNMASACGRHHLGFGYFLPCCLAALDLSEARIFKRDISASASSLVLAYLPMHEIISLFRTLIAMHRLYSDSVVLERHLHLVLVRILEASACGLENDCLLFSRDECTSIRRIRCSQKA